MKWYILLAYNLDNGSRGALGVVNSPFKPNERSIFYFDGNIKTKWVEAFNLDISSCGFKVEIRKLTNSN